MKVVLDDEQKAIVLATLRDQLRRMPWLLTSGKLSHLESAKVQQMLRISEDLAGYLSETAEPELIFSKEQLAIIVFGLTSFEETCCGLLEERERISGIRPDINSEIREMLLVTASALHVLGGAFRNCED